MDDDIDTDCYIGSGFRKELEGLLNKYSMENGSGTPDYILAGYLTDCLMAFDNAVTRRKNWYAPTPLKDTLPTTNEKGEGDA